jgi:hypothetical protein
MCDEAECDGAEPDNDEMGQPGKKKPKPTALAKHRAAMRKARADLRRAENEGWAWEAMYAMLARLIERAAEAMLAGKSADDL